MKRRPTSIRTKLSVSVLALTLIAPWALGQDPDRITEIRRLAEQGDPEAQYILGGNGEGVLDAEAARWYHLAAEQGHAEAQYILGLMYGSGRGVLKDEAEAVRWYRLAAEQGHATAQQNLGRMYHNGRGVSKDDVEAARWFRLAAEQGLATAQLALGSMYATGSGVLKDFVLAHMWLNIAGANGAGGRRGYRNILERLNMTRAEISRATELARTCMASDYQDCKP